MEKWGLRPGLYLGAWFTAGGGAICCLATLPEFLGQVQTALTGREADQKVKYSTLEPPFTPLGLKRNNNDRNTFLIALHPHRYHFERTV